MAGRPLIGRLKHRGFIKLGSCQTSSCLPNTRSGVAVFQCMPGCMPDVEMYAWDSCMSDLASSSFDQSDFAPVASQVEPFWNPYLEEQAISRADRIGQTRVVQVFKLYVPGELLEPTNGAPMLRAVSPSKDRSHSSPHEISRK